MVTTTVQNIREAGYGTGGFLRVQDASHSNPQQACAVISYAMTRVPH